MINPKEIIKVGLILFIITAVSALLLAVANNITAPIIDRNNQINTENSMKTVLPSAADFEKVEIDASQITEAYIATNNGEVIGACVVSEANGYGGSVKVLTGINKDGTVAGIDILEHSETPGLGANADKDDFKDQFKGHTKNISVSKDAKDNEINAMSGATITSKAVTDAVNAALGMSGILLGNIE